MDSRHLKTMKKTLLLMMALIAAMSVQASSVYISNFSISSGQTKTVYVYLNNTMPNILAMQCDIYLPDELDFASAPVRYGLSNNSSYNFGASQYDGSGTNYRMYRILISTYGTPFITSSGYIASFQVKCRANNAAGSAKINVKNIQLSGYTNNPLDDPQFDTPSDTQTTVTFPTPDAYFTTNEISLNNGQTKKIQFTLNTSLNITDLVFDLTGINLTPNVSSLTLLGTAANTHTRQVNASLGRVLITSSSNAILPKGTPIFELNVTANNNAQKYGYSLNLINCNLSDPSANAYFLPDHSFVPVKQGYDVNGDGNIDVNDVTQLINKILGHI